MLTSSAGQELYKNAIYLYDKDGYLETLLIDL